MEPRPHWREASVVTTVPSMQPREISNHLDNSCLKFVANRLYYVIRAVSGIKETSCKGENPVKLLHSLALREFQPN